MLERYQRKLPLEVLTHDTPLGYGAPVDHLLRHVAEDATWHYTLAEGAKGVQLAEAGYQSSRERRWIDLPDLEI